jgi:hypothetical protein
MPSSPQALASSLTRWIWAAFAAPCAAKAARVRGGGRGRGGPRLQAQGVGQGDDHAARGGGIVALVRPGRGRDELRAGGEGREEEPLGDRIERRVPRLFVERLRRRGDERSAGGEHQRVQASEGGRPSGDEVGRVLGPAHVAAHSRRRRGAGREQGGDGGVAGSAGRARRDAHRRAVGGEIEGERAPQAANAAHEDDAGTGDVHGPSVK